MLLHSIRARDLLSYGSATESLDLKPLNVLIGPNGSGKSNLIDVIALLRGAAGDLDRTVQEHGGIGDLMWKGREPGRAAMVTAVIDNPAGSQPLRYVLQFRDENGRLAIVDEQIENASPFQGHDKPYFFYQYQHGQPVLNVRGQERRLQREQIDPSASILAQRKDPDQYPEITYLGEVLARIRIYRDWIFGRNAPARLAQKADLRSDLLDEDCQNVALVLSRLRREPSSKQRLLAALRELFAGVDDFEVSLVGGRAQVYFQEGRFSVPATRLSDGTLRYLCLLAILCDPQPPPLICIEEPELGLHPDVLPTVAGLLVEASSRTQLVVTTHSDVLVDALSEQPEAIVVCEKVEGSTRLRRLVASELAEWLKQYRLGTLWTKGVIGGNRW